jgi:hypothetical protein
MVIRRVQATSRLLAFAFAALPLRTFRLSNTGSSRLGTRQISATQSLFSRSFLLACSFFRLQPAASRKPPDKTEVAEGAGCWTIATRKDTSVVPRSRGCPKHRIRAA